MEMYNPEWAIIICIVLLVFLANIIIKFNVGYYKNGKKIMNRTEITKKYIYYI